MSPKPVDVARALETLRRERPAPEAGEALLRAIHRPVRRRRYARPLAFAMMTTALALALVFPPRTKAGSAWADTLRATLDAPASHSVELFAPGKKGMEEWRSGVKRATVLYRRDGAVQCEMRSDGKRALNYFGWADVARFRHEALAANARDWAIVSKDAPGLRSPFELPMGSPQTLLADPNVKLLGHTDAASGQPETYQVRQTYDFGRRTSGKPITQDFTLEIDATSGRVSAIVAKNRGKGEGFSRTEIDYPESIPNRVFEPRVQVAKVAETYDLDAQAKTIQRTLRLGIAKKGPVTLRAVLLDGDGALWAFWTGALPGAKLTHPFSIPGMKAGPAYSNSTFTAAWKASPNINGVPTAAAGPRLGGMARVPSRKLGATVDIDVPYPGGVARFKNAPIVRIGFIQHADAVLGVKREYR